MIAPKRWQVHPNHPLTASLAETLRVPPLVAHLLAYRGYENAGAAAEFLNPRMRQLHDPAMIPGMDAAAERMITALRGGERIVVYGDYDVDGITASSILWHMMRALRPELKIALYIPHRMEEGYGLNQDALQKLVKKGAKLIVTVDCGITAVAEAGCLESTDADLIITDHHEIGDALPMAYALVHPRLHDFDPDEPPYPFGELCGAGVAWKLAWHLARTWFGTDKLPAEIRDLLMDLLPLAAMGTVADIVPLRGENRVIVRYGLERIGKTPFEGLQMLIEAAGVQKDKVDTGEVGFQLGPRLNAVGRLGHAKEALELLTSAKGNRAKELAQLLNEVNEERQVKQQNLADSAKRMVRETGLDRPENRIIILSDSEWHAGILGITASTLVQTFYRPTILMQEREDGSVTGSARSIEGFDIHAALVAHADYFQRFGGHAMAAGLTMPIQDLEAFRTAMSNYARARISEQDLVPSLRLDAQVRLRTLNLETWRMLRMLAPFGQSNPEPRFLVPQVKLVGDVKVMKEKHVSFTVEQAGITARCVGWNMAARFGTVEEGTLMDIACTLDVNTFRGNTAIQLMLLDARPAQSENHA